MLADFGKARKLVHPETGVLLPCTTLAHDFEVTAIVSPPEVQVETAFHQGKHAQWEVCNKADLYGVGRILHGLVSKNTVDEFRPGHFPALPDAFSPIQWFVSLFCDPDPDARPAPELAVAAFSHFLSGPHRVGSLKEAERWLFAQKKGMYDKLCREGAGSSMKEYLNVEYLCSATPERVLEGTMAVQAADIRRFPLP